MIFNYKDFILKMEKSADRKDKIVYDAWLKCGGGHILEEESFYEYISQYKPIKYKAPDFLSDKEKDLLLMLICSSFSCSYEFVFSSSDDKDLIPELQIAAVDSGGQSVAKFISELYQHQFESLFYVLISEAINLASMSLDCWEPLNTLPNFRKENLARYNQRSTLINNQMKRRACYDI